jgi:hypothetical protein
LRASCSNSGDSSLALASISGGFNVWPWRSGRTVLTAWCGPADVALQCGHHHVLVMRDTRAHSYPQTTRCEDWEK